MPKIDTKAWKEFRLGDLFDVVPTKGKNTYGLEDGCDLAYIAASRENNGVNRMIAKDNMADFISAGNCLVFIHIGDAAAGFCHYVRDDFVGMAGKTSCGYLKNHVMTETLGLFLAGVIRNVNEGLYSFGESWTGNRLMNTMLPLPATPDGQPDWAYMDAYMSEVLKKEEVFAEHLASLTAEAVADGHKLDTSGWKAFRIGDLFDIHPTRAYKRINSELLVATGNVPVVANSAQNNGVVGFSDLPATENGGIITFSDTTDANAIFYQAQPFIGYAHVQGMYPKFQKISDFGMLFLVSAFQSQALRMNFDYANKFRRDIALNIEIYLPVTSDGQPDWAYMEEYMRQIMAREQAFADHLASFA